MIIVANLSVLYKLFIFYLILIEKRIKSHKYNYLTHFRYGSHPIYYSPQNGKHQPVVILKTHHPSIKVYINSCPKNDQRIHFYPYDERKYIQCCSGRLNGINCRLWEPFSIKKRDCLPQTQMSPNNYVSTPKVQLSVPSIMSDEIYCPLDLFGLFPHPFSNEKYLKCVDGRLYNKTCSSGFVFNFRRKFCVQNTENLFKILPAVQDRYKGESFLETRTRDNSTTLQCPKDLSGTFVHPFDCTNYISCSRAGTKIFSCSNSEVFSFREDKCKVESQTDEYDHVPCIKSSENDDPEEPFSVGVFCAPTGSMNYSHPQTDRKYVNCNEGKLQIKRCPRNEIFSLETRKCFVESTEMDEENNGVQVAKPYYFKVPIT